MNTRGDVDIQHLPAMVTRSTRTLQDISCCQDRLQLMPHQHSRTDQYAIAAYRAMHSLHDSSIVNVLLVALSSKQERLDGLSKAYHAGQLQKRASGGQGVGVEI